MFKLSIRTPYEEVFKGEVESLQFASEEGELGIHEDHASITASVNFTHIVVSEENSEDTYIARKGIFLFKNETNEATFLLAYCEKESEIDYKTVQEYIHFLEQQLEEGHDLSDFQISYIKGEKIAVEEQLKSAEHQQ